jgi:hypothetical protein
MTVKELYYLRERLRPTLSTLFIRNFHFSIILKRRCHFRLSFLFELVSRGCSDGEAKMFITD